jgi:GH43 family beta-xylosidase
MRRAAKNGAKTSISGNGAHSGATRDYSPCRNNNVPFGKKIFIFFAKALKFWKGDPLSKDNRHFGLKNLAPELT